MIELDTTRFGRLHLPKDAVLHFPQGLYGLEGKHDYCLLEHDDLAGFYWLQSVDSPEVALIVVDPFRYLPEYEVEILDATAELLKVQDPSELTLYTTVSVASDHSQVSTNLLGPIAINHEERIGAQVIQDGSSYTCRHVLASRPAADNG